MKYLWFHKPFLSVHISYLKINGLISYLFKNEFNLINMQDLRKSSYHGYILCIMTSENLIRLISKSLKLLVNSI